MWLIHTESLKLECFLGKDIPKYAILSHTWGDEEVTFQDWKDLEKVSQKRGLIKIKSACAQAERDGLSYLWVDTTCIDKSSSAELSEAINSMFSWYKYSEICYVYLVDVEDPDDVSGKLLYETKFMDSFRNSRWFTRGWTLQELLAPRFLQFFTQDWKPIIVHPHDMVWPTASRRHQHHLLQLLSDITSIRVHALFGSDYAMRCSSGEKFSWMAGRETTREEDMAYCLIGIFDINMPLLYGEGSKAFGRLQEEIAKQSTDHSLFAWEWPQSDSPRSGRLPDLFAGSIEHFSNLNPKLVGYSLEPNDDVDEDEEYNPLASLLSLTNFGLSINLALIPTAD
ncbi:heterokaryon incompatibility protein-domain-containing protein, partial [Xylogone sp. PMI_703]